MNSLLFGAWIEDVVGVVATIFGVVIFLFAYVFSPILILIIFCDARTAFRWISRCANRYVAWVFFLGCTVWLFYWYFHLVPLIAEVFVQGGK